MRVVISGESNRTCGVRSVLSCGSLPRCERFAERVGVPIGRLGCESKRVISCWRALHADPDECAIKAMLG